MIKSVYEQACEAKYSYAYGIDTRDWPRLSTIFAPTLIVDFTSVGYPSELVLTRNEWVGEIRKLMDGLDVSHHSISNVLCDQVGDDLRIRSYVTAQHLLKTPGADDRRYDLSGWYDDRLVWIDDRWKFSSIKLAVVTTSGDRDVFRDAIRRSRRVDE